ncbi:MAG TPA: hypothetical protein VIY54_05705 [Steroidobacteraceae bacterium]
MTERLVGIVCALHAEARHLNPVTRRRPLASLPDGTLLAVSGMGPPAAARAARALLDAGATALVSWGMAGGLDPAIGAGTIFLPAEVLPLGGTAIATTRRWMQALGGALAQHNILCGGRLLSTASAVGSRQEKAALFRATGAAAVDMESLAVGEAAATRQLPFIAVRVIVDGAQDDVPAAASAAADASGHLQAWQLLCALARAPGDVPSLIRLAARYRAASRSLAAVARYGPLGPSLWAAPLPGHTP